MSSSMFPAFTRWIQHNSNTVQPIYYGHGTVLHNRFLEIVHYLYVAGTPDSVPCRKMSLIQSVL